MRVTLHLSAENPMLSIVLSVGWPPKVARDITRPVTRRPPGRLRAPARAAPPRGRLGSGAGSSAPAPESPQAAPRPRAEGSPTRVGQCPPLPPASSPGNAPAGPARRRGRPPGPRRGDPSPADCAAWRDTSHSRRPVCSPPVGRPHTNRRIHDTFASGSSCRGASIEGRAKERAATLLGRALTPWHSADPSGSRRRREVDLIQAAAKAPVASHRAVLREDDAGDAPGTEDQARRPWRI